MADPRDVRRARRLGEVRAALVALLIGLAVAAAVILERG